MLATSKKQVLCVDDSRDDCDLLSIVLGETLYETQVALTLSDGLRLAKSNTFDLYLLDLWLPDGTGFELIEKIRAFDPLTPVIFLSASARQNMQQQASQLGAQAFFTKPVNYDKLVAAVSQMLWAGTEMAVPNG